MEDSLRKRKHDSEFTDFVVLASGVVEIAFGSLTELFCEMEISYELGYLTKEQYEETEHQMTIISKQLSNLHKSVTNNFTKETQL